MNEEIGVWNGFRSRKFTLNGKAAIVVEPEEGRSNGKWALKTEYFDAFPRVEVELLKKGWHIAGIANVTRWHKAEDDDAKAALAEYMHRELGLSPRCVPIGLSCGGMHALYFAAAYPQYISCMYLDAPVVNLLSCPAGLGAAHAGMFEEFEHDTGISKTRLLSFRDHPLDHLPEIAAHKIPTLLVCGDSDTVVPYEENGLLIREAYEKAGSPIEVIIKPGCDHHPHGLADYGRIVRFIEEHDI